MFKFSSDFTGETEGYLYTDTYQSNGNLYIGVMAYDSDCEGFVPYTNLTTNIITLPDSLVAVDTNNNQFNNIVDVLVNDGVLIPTEMSLSSGFCRYPVFKATDKVKEYCEGESV